MSQFLRKEWVKAPSDAAPHGVVVSTVNLANAPGGTARYRELIAHECIETAVFPATEDGNIADYGDLDMERSGAETKWEQQHDAMAKKWGRP